MSIEKQYSDSYVGGFDDIGLHIIAAVFCLVTPSITPT